jgi:hypothetical protein
MIGFRLSNEDQMKYLYKSIWWVQTSECMSDVTVMVTELLDVLVVYDCPRIYCKVTKILRLMQDSNIPPVQALVGY